jgi:hypothetical protein
MALLSKNVVASLGYLLLLHSSPAPFLTTHSALLGHSFSPLGSPPPSRHSFDSPGRLPMLGLPVSVGPSTANKFALTASVKRSLLVGWLFLAGIFLLVHQGGATPALPSVRLPAALARRVAPEQTPLGLPDIWQGKRIGIWEAADFHDEVAGALVYSLKKSGIEPRLFRRQGFRFGFLDAVKGFWPNPSWETDDEAVLNKAVLENEVDILVLSTCASPV